MTELPAADRRVLQAEVSEHGIDAVLDVIIRHPQAGLLPVLRALADWTSTTHTELFSTGWDQNQLDELQFITTLLNRVTDRQSPLGDEFGQEELTDAGAA
jgi:hypothetical protein